MMNGTYTLDYSDENKRQEEIYKRLRDRQRSDLRKILDKPEGRRLLWRILGEGRIFGSCYSTNSLEMARLEGKRDNALWILREIMDVNPDSFAAMQRESMSDKLILEGELKNKK
jgi:hypothetical protein